MPFESRGKFCLLGFLVVNSLAVPALRSGDDIRLFNVKTYGATGKKADDAQKAIQLAVEACGKAGGGMVYPPPGDYTSGTIYLRSHVRFHVEADATLWASTKESAFPKTGCFTEDLQNITIEGRGTIDGQAEYFWRTDDPSAVYLRGQQIEDFLRGSEAIRI
jgi:polygalacturonase